jgi:hypothetical protein
MSGDGSLIARVTQNTQPNSQAGIMMSETLGVGSKSATVVYNFNGAYFEAMMCTRATAGVFGQWAFSTVTNVPTWLKLVRSGNTFTGCASADGTNWTTLASSAISMAGTIYIGLVVESTSTNQLDEATFDNISAPCSAPTGLASTATSGQVKLGWTACLSATSYHIKRATVSGGPYTTIGATISPTISYTDGAVISGTNYYYVVSAVNAMGESANSTQINVTPPQLVMVPCNLTASVTASNQITLMWTNGLTNVLYTPSLNPPVVWTVVSQQADLSNNQWTVTLPQGTNGCGFYRLRQ